MRAARRSGHTFTDPAWAYPSVSVYILRFLCHSRKFQLSTKSKHGSRSPSRGRSRVGGVEAGAVAVAVAVAGKSRLRVGLNVKWSDFQSQPRHEAQTNTKCCCCCCCFRCYFSHSFVSFSLIYLNLGNPCQVGQFHSA